MREGRKRKEEREGERKQGREEGKKEGKRRKEEKKYGGAKPISLSLQRIIKPW